uniref:protein-tyrosine-phosphatase n=1 Tax=Macrostomum lignano TaxID=282301 RepID=A0A1I8G638_9PLAT
MLSAIELELANNDERNLWQDAYRRLSLASGSDGPSSAALSTAAARHPDNRLLNRYRDVLPYDHSRVRLSPISRSHASSLGLSGDYINASIVRAEHAGRVFAMAQGPLPATVGHFWLMVWQLRSRGVVMLNRVFEKGALKCHPYFPDERTKRVDCPDVGLRVELVSSESFGYYIVRGFRLSLLSNKTSDPEPASAVRDLLHYQYLTWPDFGVPQTPGAFLNFLMAVRRSGLLSDPDRPPVVHCSAGIGRTGSLAVIDVCLALIARRGSLYGVDLPGEIRRLRCDRMGLVQTPDQLRFCYQAVVMGGRAILANGVDRADSLSFSIDEADRRQFGMANNSFAEAGDSDDESSSSSSGGSNHSSAINDNAYSLLRGNLDRQRTTWLSCQHRLSGGGGGGVPFPLYNEEDEAADDKRAAAAGVDAAEAAFKPIPTPVVRLRDLAWISLLTALGAYLVYQMGAA